MKLHIEWQDVICMVLCRVLDPTIDSISAGKRGYTKRGFLNNIHKNILTVFKCIFKYITKKTVGLKGHMPLTNQIRRAYAPL